jgi:GT2 family glycosyltransferase
VLPSLSIVIPSHNRVDLLNKCLHSVIRHAPPGTQILVVDDNSPSACVTETARKFPSVEVIRLSKRSGFAVAVNHGVQLARGTIVELLNDDTEVCPGWAEAALQVFENEKIGAVAPLVLMDSSGKVPRVDSAGDRYYWGGIAGKRGHRQELGAENLVAGPVFGASGSSAFIRRDLFLRAGGFPEKFGAYFEDVDLAFRIHRMGFAIHFEPRSRVLHRVSASYGKPSRRLLEKQSLNEERVFWRNMPMGMLGSALPHHIAVLAAKSVQRWQSGGLAPFICGRLRILSEVKELVQHRQWLRELGPKPQVQSWGIEKVFWGL